MYHYAMELYRNIIIVSNLFLHFLHILPAAGEGALTQMVEEGSGGGWLPAWIAD